MLILTKPYPVTATFPAPYGPEIPYITDYAPVMLVKSTFRPGPMVELIDTFFT